MRKQRKCKDKGNSIDSFEPMEMPDRIHRKFGKWDGYWEPDDELYEIPNAFCVHLPSRKYPYGYIKHFYSKKFSRLLAYHRPDIYCKIHKIDKRFKHYKLLMAWRFKQKVLRKGK